MDKFTSISDRFYIELIIKPGEKLEDNNLNLNLNEIDREIDRFWGKWNVWLKRDVDIWHTQIDYGTKTVETICIYIYTGTRLCSNLNLIGRLGISMVYIH